MKTSRRLGTWALAGGIFLAGMVGGPRRDMAISLHRPADPAHGAKTPAQIQSLRIVGKADYEQGHYKRAIVKFTQVIQAGEALATDHLNLGLALMQANYLNKALGEFDTAREMAPRLLAVRYNLGILYMRELRYPMAEREMLTVTKKDPDAPSGWFNLSDIYFDEAESAPTPAARTALLHASLAAELRVVHMGFARAKNFFVAALYHCFTIEIRLDKTAEARRYLAEHVRYHSRVPGLSLQAAALEGGKYGAILVSTAPAVMPDAYQPPKELRFKEIPTGISLLASGSYANGQSKAVRASEYSIEYARKNLLPQFGPSIAVGDFLGHGSLGIYVTNPAGSNHLLVENPNGAFSDVTAKAGVEGPSGAISATFADYNNSSYPSLFVAGLGGVHLYQNNKNGTFTDVTAKAGLAPPPSERYEVDTRAILFDADNDGFLDLLVLGYTNLRAVPRKAIFDFPQDFPGVVCHFYRNNGDGTFTDITKQSGLAGAIGRMRDATFADFDGKGYPDLAFFRDNGPPLLYLNEGADHFVNATRTAGLAFSRATAFGGAVEDFRHQGEFDLALLTASGYTLLENNGHAQFTTYRDLPPLSPPRSLLAFRGIVADLEGGGYAGLLLQNRERQWRYIADRNGRFSETPLALPLAPGQRLAAVRPFWSPNSTHLELIGVTEEGRLVLWRRTGAAPTWLDLALVGSKSNFEGVGDIVELKDGNYYNKVIARHSPLRIYTGDLKKLDVVRVTWPNGIVENSINVKTDAPLTMRESERLASSCPFLYVWNGHRYVYFTDVLGASPLGELQPDGAWSSLANPEEYVRLGDHPQLQNGVYTFQLTSEMREVDFVDRVRLLAVDHRAGESLFSNEVYSSTPVHPRIFAVGKRRFPISAVDDRGHNVLPDLLAVDGHYPTDFRLNRILGLANLHTLTLNLGRFSNQDPVAIYLTGWVFWTDSNASRALMSNPKLSMIGPYLQVRNRKGQWETVIPDMGMPSGTNRTMRVDLTGKFPTADHHVRIVTNLCIYWDRIFYTTDELAPPAPKVVPLVSANLHYRGFSTPVTDPSLREPDYFEYTKLMRQPPWNPLSGNYTRYGNVKALIEHGNSQLVVMGPGDAITLRFDARELPPLKSGWARDFFLDLTGYAKDGEPNTADSGTVGPLPFRAMTTYPPAPSDLRPSGRAYQRYLSQYETRPSYRLLPPLAPSE